MTDHLEIARTVDQLESELDDLALRGLRAVGPARLGKLRLFVEEFERIGAEHLAARLRTICDCVEGDDPAGAAALLRAQTSLRLFDRLLTVDVATELLAAGTTDEGVAADAVEQANDRPE